jgi:hypothetical protein
MDFRKQLRIPEATIEDLRNHPPEVIVALRHVLATGAVVWQDPKRANCFEVQSNSLVYYIYVSPASGSVTLLGIWQREGQLSAISRVA